ncbi:dehydrogenase E1 component-domain-containing protein [Gigaspora rosea]|uniref:Pyruvate dehydrogenase E1 component subunit alpha n=1 Tax=Gigaspora rosea TaxID=44941 RepID=A0A397U3H4_9GLOM|nr:dehydrogenase E1 component-domain-containing protein [Gigaspora rosea]
MLLPVSRVVTRVAACRGSFLFRGFSSESSSESVKYTLPETSFKTYKCDPPPLEIEVKKNEALDMYKDMVLMRRMETTADNLYKMKLIRGFCHLCTGQEAVPVGMEAACTRDDAIITAYRCHGYTLMRGATVHQIFAELMGRSTGISYGKGGSMHMFAKSFYGGNGIVGAQVPVGAGIAFTQKYLGVKNATFIIYGDGAANQGQVFEAFNMAALWELPAIFVCENNFFGMGTSAARSSANPNYYTRGEYVPGIRVNGMDVLAVKHSCAWAKEWTFSGKGPMVMEMVTYRYGGHSMSDPGTTYRTREEVQHMRSTNDPITGLRTKILEWGFATENDLKQYEKEARAIVDEAAEKAKNDPYPKESELWTDIYVRGTEPDSIRGRECEEIGTVHKS